MGHMGQLLAGFADRYDLAYQTCLFFRIVVAGFLGYLIGYERKNRYKGGWNEDPCHRGHGSGVNDGGFQIRL